MIGIFIDYARCSTDKQDLTAQHDRLIELRVATERIYLTETNRERPGLDQTFPARGGDTLMAPTLTTRQQTHLVELDTASEHNVSELAKLFGVSRATAYRVLDRHPAPQHNGMRSQAA